MAIELIVSTVPLAITAVALFWDRRGRLRDLNAREARFLRIMLELENESEVE
jgi:heme exporter protein D